MDTKSSTTTWKSRAIENCWENKTIKTALQILFLVGLGAVTAFMKKMDPSLGIPGSSAPLWLGPIVLGRLMVRKDGAATLCGASVAVWGVSIGIYHTLFYNLALYGGAGLTLDAFSRIPRIHITSLVGAVLCGIAAHMVKFGFIIGAAYTSSVVKHFMLVGVAKSAGTHLVFGALAGLAGWSVFKLAEMGTRKLKKEG